MLFRWAERTCDFHRAQRELASRTAAEGGAMAAIEWTEIQDYPTYRYRSADGLTRAEIEHDDEGSGWLWSIWVLRWVKPGEQAYANDWHLNGKATRHVGTLHGEGATPEDCKQQVAERLRTMEAVL